MLKVSSDPEALRRKWEMCLLGALCSGYFLAFGSLLLPLLGLQSDEVIFLSCLYIPKRSMAWFSFFHHYYPAMIMSYLGALKSWLYAPALLAGPLSVWSVRLPMLITAAVTMLVLGYVTRRIDGVFAAGAAMLLFATDGSLLLTAVNDWGPVVLTNFLFIAAVWCLLLWAHSRRSPLLFVAGLLIGLNLWNKALFIWILSGMVVAAAAVGHPYFRILCSKTRLLVLLFGFLIGAYPLLRFNLHNHAATVEQNTHLDPAGFATKLHLMALTLDGQMAPSALVDMRKSAPDEVNRPLTTQSRDIAARTPNISTLLLYVGPITLIGGLAKGTAVERRWIALFVLADLIAWGEAALTVGAGASLHHTALFLLPCYLALGIAFGVVSRSRWPAAKSAVAVALALVSLRAAAAQNLIYANLLNYEARPAWSNAEQSFTRDLLQAGVQQAIVLDWGISDVITTRTRNRVVVANPARDLQNERFDPNLYLSCQAPACVIVQHMPMAVLLPEIDRAFRIGLDREHLAMVITHVYESTHGVPVLFTFHVVRSFQSYEGTARTDNTVSQPTSHRKGVHTRSMQPSS